MASGFGGDTIGRGRVVIEGDLAGFDAELRSVEAMARKMAASVGSRLGTSLDTVERKAISATGALKNMGKVLTGFGAMLVINRIVSAMTSLAKATEEGQAAVGKFGKEWERLKGSVSQGLEIPGMINSAAGGLKALNDMNQINALRREVANQQGRPQFVSAGVGGQGVMVSPNRDTPILDEMTRQFGQRMKAIYDRRRAEQIPINQAGLSLGAHALGANVTGIAGDVVDFFKKDVIDPIANSLKVAGGAAGGLVAEGANAKRRGRIADIEAQLDNLRRAPFQPQRFETADFAAAIDTAIRNPMTESTEKQIRKLEEQLTILKQIRDKVDPKARFAAAGVNP